MRTFGDEQVPGYARVETCIASRAGVGGRRLRDRSCPETATNPAGSGVVIVAA